MEKLALKIRGMDCAEEIAILKQALSAMVPEDALSFDLLNGKLIIENGESQSADIIAAVNKTGMQAIRWSDHVAREAADKTFWEEHGRTACACASGMCIVAGFLFHASLLGFSAALTGGEESVGYPALTLAAYIAAILSGGWFIFPKALFAARSFRPDMNLLMVTAVIGAGVIGEWFEAAAVACLFALALLLESWSVGRARRAIAALMDLSPQTARCMEEESSIERPVAEVEVGARILVKPGERIPLDGVVVKGSTSINQAPITGESMPVKKGLGDSVFAGSINESGVFEFETSKPANDTTLARIIQMVEEAQSRRAPSEQWVETFARYYTPAMMVLAFAIAVLPPLLFVQPFEPWVYKGLVLLVIACPCALVISTPVSIVAGLSAAAKAGILIKGGTFLEAPSRLRVVAMDKTGTLTKGEPEVRRIIPFNGHDERELLERAAALETHSEHPLARAILRRAAESGIAPAPAEDFRALKGKGAEATINGRRFWIGSHRLLHEKTSEGSAAPEPEAIHTEALELEQDGHSVVVVGNDTHVCGLIGIADALRPEGPSAIDALRENGIRKIIMLTGDNEGTARAIGKLAGVDDLRYEQLPEYKVEAIRQLVEEYGAVAMVGDGVNDAPAMATATLAVAMGAAGTDAALETADIALMSDDLSKLPWLIQHSRRTLGIIKQNIAFALGIKVLFIVLSVIGFASLWMAIAADMGASLLVIANGLRLLKVTQSGS